MRPGVLAGGAAAALLAAALVVVVVTGRPRGLAAAGALAAALAAVLFILSRARGRPLLGTAPLLLALLLAAVVQLHAAGGRLGGDGVSYYVYTRSLVKDLDLDFTNEYTHYEMIDRADIAVPTRTGLRRSIFAVGPGLAWIPFFLLGEMVARGETLLGLPADLGGYGPEHVNAVALGSLLYGFAAVLCIHRVLARHFSAGVALLAAVLVWWATFLHWYMVQQPAMSHAVSTAGAAFVVWLWDLLRARGGPARWALLGLACGLAMCLRWQNGVLLCLPAWDLLALWRRAPREAPRLLRGALLLGAAAFAGALPQMAAWKTIYGEWLLRYPPHGADFLRLDRPFVLETLFSSRHGLLSWTPVLWAGFLGFAWVVRHRPGLGWPLVVPALAMTYVNMCSGDWWAGGSFSNRRFDSVLPLLAVGMAGSLEWCRRALARHPQLAVAAVMAPVVVWTLGAMTQVARGHTSGARASFASLAGGTAREVSGLAGSPQTWPASWIFAWRHRRPAAQYDRAVGRYLFYRQNNLGGRIDLGRPDDEALLGEGWTEGGEHQGRTVRGASGPVRLLAPLDVPEDLEVLLTAASSAAAEVRIVVNAREAGRAAVGPGWTEGRLRVAASFWRRDLNDVVLVPSAPVWVDAVDFVRAAAPEAPRGFQAR